MPIAVFDEPVSCLTHLGGAAVFACLSFFLVRRGNGSRRRMVFLGVFAFSAVFLLSMSGVSHLLAPTGAARTVLRRLDHAGVFMLIAGTFTGGHGLLCRGFWRWGMITIIWVLAISGITLKTVFFETMPEWFGLALYLDMGWIGLFSGGVAYTIGALFEFLRDPMLIPGVLGPHELFHIAVLVGLGCHWKLLYDHAREAPVVRNRS